LPVTALADLPQHWMALSINGKNSDHATAISLLYKKALRQCDGLSTNKLSLQQESLFGARLLFYRQQFEQFSYVI
jgi:hypothetical protein